MKVWNYMAIMLTMMIFLYFLGFNPAGTKDTLGDIGIEVNETTGELVEGDVANSNWFNDLFNLTDGIIAIIGVGGAIIVGLYGKTFDWKLVLLPFFTVFVVKFVSFGWSVVQLADEIWLQAIIATVFLPLSGMFLFSVIEWLGGSVSD